ncbi:PREDICTED: TMV resistance protein N-like [Nicotiana attenuata]|nr:PREDICTED: TMV resistance protein N-like [Nicotiana attenuata]
MAMKSIHDLVTKRKKLQRVKLGAHNDSMYNLFAHALFQNISSLRHDISASDSLSDSVFTIVHPWNNIPSWFLYKGRDSSVSVNLPENWYIPHKFLGFAVCYCGSLIDTTAQLIPVSDDGMSCMTQKLALSSHSECDTAEWDTEDDINFFLVDGLWNTSKANGKTPNDYGIIRLSFSGETKEYGVRLLYKEEAEVEALPQMRENNNDSVTHESSCCCCRCRIL